MDQDHSLGNQGDVERFRFRVEQFVKDQKVTGVEVTADGIALHFENGAAVKFQADGKDMRIIFAWAGSSPDMKVTVQ